MKGCHASSRFGRSMLCVLLSAQSVVYATAKHASPGRVEAWHPHPLNSIHCLRLMKGCHASSRLGRSMLCVLLSLQWVVYATAKHASSRFGRSMLCVLLIMQWVVYATVKHASPGRVEAWHPSADQCRHELERVDSGHTVALPCVPSGRRPSPVRWSIDQVAANGIGVDVFDLPPQLIIRDDVAIITSASLPEAGHAGGVMQSREDRRL